ncbi:MAG: hypothetical protein KBA66_05555 [Leptospiraceae bacterium]|nr:hypothetical protein [Leptospiraceae bacterium]
MSDKQEQKDFELKSIHNLLGAANNEMSFLNKLESEEINKLRNQIIVFMQDGQKDIWVPMAKVSKFMPNFLNAKVSEDILGASIAANLSYHLHPKDAIGIASHFSIKFFCDVLEHLVPEKISEMIKQSPYDLMRRAVNELITRKNYFLIGSLIDYTPIESVDKIARSLENLGDLVSVTFNARDKSRVLNLFKRFDDNKIYGAIAAGLNGGLSKELQTIYEHADDELLEKTRKIIQSKDPALLEKYNDMINHFEKG